jgi:hypothetical protein
MSLVKLWRVKSPAETAGLFFSEGLQAIGMNLN